MIDKRVEYSIEHRTNGGNWVAEGLYFDTYDEAQEELKLCPGQPKERYRIVKHELTILFTKKEPDLPF